MAGAFEVNLWRRELREGAGNAFLGTGRRRWEEGRLAQLERKIGQQALEIDFSQGCLQHIEEQQQLQAWTGRPLSTRKSKQGARRSGDDRGTDVPPSGNQPGWLLSLPSQGTTARCGRGTARRRLAVCVGIPQLKPLLFRSEE